MSADRRTSLGAGIALLAGSASAAQAAPFAGAPDAPSFPPKERFQRWPGRREKPIVEAHLFSEGGHGFGVHLPKDLPGSRWPDLFALWMRKHRG